MLRNRIHVTLGQQRLPVTAIRQLHSSAARPDSKGSGPKVAHGLDVDYLLSPNEGGTTSAAKTPRYTRVSSSGKSESMGFQQRQRPRGARGGDRARSGNNRPPRPPRRNFDFSEEPVKEQEFVYESSPYQPAKVNVETLAGNVPAVPLTALGQSSCLQRELAGFMQKSKSWGLKDWQKYEKKREHYAKAVLDGRHPDVKSPGGKYIADHVRTMALRNATYGRSDLRTVVGAVKQRLSDLQLPKPQETNRIKS